MSEKISALNDHLLSQLECPVCLETCVPPIYMCCNGHSVCAKCQPNLTRCSTCRAQGKPTARCIQLERIAEMVEMPCANQPHGCPFVCKTIDLAKHLAVCEFGTYECRVCNWRGSVEDLELHVSFLHGSNSIILPPSGMMTIDNKIINLNASTHLFVAFNDARFWLNFKPALPGHGISISMRLVDNSPMERMYFSLEFPSQSGRLKVAYRSEVLDLTENVGSGYTDFMIPTYILDSYIDKLVFTISIFSSKQPSARTRKFYWFLAVLFVASLLSQLKFKEKKVTVVKVIKEGSIQQFWFLWVFFVMIAFLWVKFKYYSIGWSSRLFELAFFVTFVLLWIQFLFQAKVEEVNVEEVGALEKFQQFLWSISLVWFY